MSDRTLMMVLLLIWGLGSWWLSSAFRTDPNERSPDFLMNMAHSPAYEAQGPNGNFQDGRNLRTPVAGTIPRGFLPFPYEATEADAKQAGEDLTNPFPADPVHLERGRRAYEIYCTVCHGTGGAGDGVVTKRGVPPPPSLLLENARKMKDGEMYHIITLGRINMPPHGAQITRDDRWKAILHVRKMQEAAK